MTSFVDSRSVRTHLGFSALSCLAAGGVSGTMAVMADAGEIHECGELRVTIDDVVYMPSLDSPPDKPHPFVYFISIHNQTKNPVTIRGRKWVVRQSDGEITVVEGEGVVGQTPVIEPGGHFSYNSYHVTAVNAEVSGAFFGETADGQRIFARIPEFRLEIPSWA